MCRVQRAERAIFTPRDRAHHDHRACVALAPVQLSFSRSRSLGRCVLSVVGLCARHPVEAVALGARGVSFAFGVSVCSRCLQITVRRCADRASACQRECVDGLSFKRCRLALHRSLRPCPSKVHQTLFFYFGFGLPRRKHRLFGVQPVLSGASLMGVDHGNLPVQQAGALPGSQAPTPDLGSLSVMIKGWLSIKPLTGQY